MTIFRSSPLDGRRRGRRWLGYAVIIFIALAGAARFLMLRAFDSGPLQPALTTISRLPVTLPDGHPALLGDTIKPGVPTVITLWASWCGPCRREAPKIAELRRRFSSDTLNLIYLNVRDAAASREDLASYMAKYGMAPDGYAVLADERIAALTNASDIYIPRTLIFDRSGKAVAKITGYKPFALDRIKGLVTS